MSGAGGPAWSVAIFAARESIADLEPTIMSVVEATKPGGVVDLLINGNRELADQAAERLASLSLGKHQGGLRLRVWYIELGDKGHAWNQYLEFIWPSSDIVFFVDGYVRVRPDAFALLAQRLSESPEHLAGTGVPTVGRSASALRRQMLATGGIHGNLFCLTHATVRALREMRFRLPLGLYRTDPTLGAVLAFNLDPAGSAWDPKGRILVHPDVTWTTEQRSVWSLADVSDQLKRKIRQAQGTLENLAVRDFLATRKLRPEKLPETATSLVNHWASARPWQLVVTLLTNPLTAVALRRLRSGRDWSAAAVRPALRLQRSFGDT